MAIISEDFLPKDDPIFSEGLQMFTIRRPLQRNENDLNNNVEKAVQTEDLEELQKRYIEQTKKRDIEQVKIRDQAKNRLKRLARIRRDRSKRLSKK